MSSVPDMEKMAAWRAFLEAHSRLIAELAEELEREAGIPLGWYDVLVQLSEADGMRLRITALAGRVLLSKSGVSRLVDRMCTAGLVTRTPDSVDGRVTWVEMTAVGRERLRAAAPVHLRGIEERFGRRISAEEARVIAAVMGRLAGE